MLGIMLWVIDGKFEIFVLKGNIIVGIGWFFVKMSWNNRECDWNYKVIKNL